MRGKILEIACFNLQSAIIAQQAGADRIELCEDYVAGGITPSREMILQAKKAVQIPLHVIIRPRAGDFYYTAQEVEQMKKDIAFCKTHHINGVVLGCLTSEKKVDLKLCKELLNLSRPMTVTFHRAIDICENILEEVEHLVEMGFDRVLTSGGKKTALEGKDNLRKLSEKFEGKIILLAGGGIRSTNISEILRAANCSEYHSAAFVGSSTVCDATEIKNLKKSFNSI
ncbi:copper homeostasis protein [Sphingobacteriaceae bacterium]|nr:copper homeostasis protein [Sphingobacteriaceae bacterium]